MQTRRLGKTGWDVSEIGLGCWQLGGDFGPVDDETAHMILAEARALDVDFWDTADVYGGGLSEQRVGAALHDSTPPLVETPPVRVATKVGRGGGIFGKYTRDNVRASIEGSAGRLGVTSIDLIQLHCIPRADLEKGEIFGWLEDFQAEGFVRHWGASVETVEEGLLCLRQPGLATLQIIFSLFRQDAAERLLPAAHEAGVGIIVRLPLASGLLSGKFTADHRFPKQDHRNYNADGKAFNVGETFAGLPFEKGVAFAHEMEKMNTTGWPLSHVAIRWILDHKQVSTVIAGVSRPQQLADNVAAAERPPLPEELSQMYAEYYRTTVRPAVRGSI